ncbi:gamma-glutamyltransferase 5a [Salvelinus alpinus]|uniref:glutathione hydrolase 5 proenzyme n=1 Tax=Salvelinus sp. IW2-2015 TaxID=2691554 RepID=UPI000CDF8A68|nr:glutathione hydrolase 5 proenzyme [Salvelinus alpinus]
MARSKARIYTCIALTLVSAIGIIILCTAFAKQNCTEGVFRSAAVAADSETCSKIGRDILQRGGSAVDGAIAALLCTSVINPQSMGIGGGSIFTVMDSSGKVKIINSRETVPQEFNPDLLSGCPHNFQMMTGSQWIGVPGEIRGYEQAHRLFGKLPWASLFHPTIKLAREGFPVPQVLGRFIPLINTDETLPVRQLFLDKNGNLLKVGDTVKFEKLADTLEIIANQGADAFYTGKVAEDLIGDIKEAGGTLSMKDLELFKVTVTDAWTIPLGEYQMHFPPPPSGGAILSFILNIMKEYTLNSASLMGKQKTLTYQRYIEACKFSNGLRKYIRDPHFNSKPRALKFTEQQFADHFRAMISSNETHDAQYYNITPYLDTMGTTHVSVIAEDGTAVSVTSTINHMFGSRVFSPKTGVILNNELADFCGKADHIVAGEQPPSSMSPVVLQSKYKTLVIGGSGGSMITTGMALTLMNHLWFGKSLEEAIAAPVVFVDSKNALKFEPDFDKAVVEDLKNFGHTVEVQKYFYNVVNAVEKDIGCIKAVSDSRKMGKAAGY